MEEKLSVIQKAIDEIKGERSIIYEFSSLNPFIDHVVITEANNLRKVYAIANNIVDRMKEHGYSIRSMEGDKDSRWILVDLDTVIVHVFLDEERDHFKLEKLYADLPCEDFSL